MRARRFYSDRVDGKLPNPYTGSYASYPPFVFLVLVEVCAFIWLSFATYSFFYKLQNTEHVFPERMPRLVLVCDAAFTFFTFAAACAAAGLTSTMERDDPTTNIDICQTLASFCRHAVASTALAFCSWFVFLVEMRYAHQAYEESKIEHGGAAMYGGGDENVPGGAGLDKSFGADPDDMATI